jgi:hypothetical protein
MLQNYPMCNIHFLQIEICVTFWQFKITKIEMEQNFMYKQKKTNEQIKNHIVDFYFRETPEQIAQSFVQFTKYCASPFHPSRSYMRDE